MLKIIELEINPSLSADTGVFEVAWVEYPAIEQDLIFFGRQKFYKAPEEVSSKACRAIKENEERGNPAATQVGKVRAQQLCNRDEISLETIKRMKSYLERAATYYTGDYDDNGTISYDLWGGKPALDWVNGILSKITEEKMEMEPNPCWEGYEPYGVKTVDGREVPNCVPIKQSKQMFVDPQAGESQDEFIGRCIPKLIGEGYEQDQASAICYSTWRERFYMDKVSFDYDGTLTSKRGIEKLEQELGYGNIIYLISARNRISDDMMRLANKYRIPSSHVYAVGSNPEKIKKVKELGIRRHYDDNPQVRTELGPVGFDFDYVLNLPDYQNTSGDTMLIEPVLLSQDCGCSQKEEFSIIGYIDGAPIFSSPEEADIVAQGLRCGGHHKHVMEDGTVGYMPCEIHPEVEGIGEEEFGWSEEDLIMKEEFNKLRETLSPEEFGAVTNSLLRGFTESEIFAMNHKNPTTYFLYKRVLNGFPDREFCDSIEGRYFRRAQIDALRDTNTEFGHNGQPYSKWLYKGGPQCVHAWERYLFQERNKAMTGGPAELGTAGIPPQSMTGKGYYPGTARYEANLSKQDVKLSGEFEPLYYADGFPMYEDLVTAQDVSYMLGCGGVTEQVEYGGRIVFQSCSTKMVRQEMKQTQMFASNEEKRMIYTPLMIPNILIPRVAEDGERYFVKFTPQTIEQIQQKFMIEQRLRSTNLEHTDKKFNDVVMVESWIVQGDKDKAYSLGFTEEQIPEGTWFGGFKVLDTPEGDMVWNKLIKPGKVKGASVEGNFLLNFSQEKVDEYLLSTIINILKTITD